MRRTSVPRVLSSLGLVGALAAPLACTKSSEGDAKQDVAATPATAEAEADPAKPTPTEASTQDGLTKVVAEAAAAGSGRLERGHALGHFAVPNASRLLAEVRTQASPPKGAAFLDEATLRSMASLGLGPRARLAERLVLDQPMGCVVVDDRAIEVPTACAVGYTGGAAAAAADFGSEGKQADAGGHAAHYVIDGQDVYLDELGGHVVVSNHAGVFAKARGYLESNIIGRADAIADDVEVVLYPKAVMERYGKEIESLLSLMRGLPTAPSDSPFADTFVEYSRVSTERTFEYYRDLDQVDLGMGLEPLGFVLRYAIYPAPGSTVQADSKAVSSGPLDATLVKQLPAESWMVMASTLDWRAAWQLESAAPVREVMIDAYAKAVGRDGAAVRSAIEAFLAENSTLYGRDVAISVMHLPGSQGGLVVSRRLGSAARPSWKPWTEGFDPTTVLGPEGVKLVTWRFQPDALTVAGVPVDRWTIEPGPEAKAKIAAEADPTIAALEKRLGRLELVIDRVELADRVLFVMAPGAQERYIEAAIAATKGGASVGGDAGLAAILARNADPSMIWAVDVARAIGWLREVLPPDAASELPAGLGGDLGDFYMSATYGASGRQHGEMVLNQRMLDGLRKLAG
jgi:hypothetical protein